MIGRSPSISLGAASSYMMIFMFVALVLFVSAAYGAQ
jgi:hypothetical protein